MWLFYREWDMCGYEYMFSGINITCSDVNMCHAVNVNWCVCDGKCWYEYDVWICDE